MQDGIIKGTGNSRYLKTVAEALALYPTYEDFMAAFVAGTLPIDLNGINAAGWDTLPTWLNKANLLADSTAEKLGLDATATPNGAFEALSGAVIPQGGLLGPLPDDAAATLRDTATNGEITVGVFPGYPYMAYLVEGQGWVPADTPVTIKWVAVEYGNGVFVAVSSTTSAISTDGKNWVRGGNISLSSYTEADCFTFGNGKFVGLARGISGQGYDIAFSSVDGTSWTSTSLSAIYSSINVVKAIAFGNGIFVGSLGSMLISSTDGVSWTKITATFTSNIINLCFIKDRFVGLPGGTAHPAAYSEDGKTWSEYANKIYSTAYNINNYAALNDAGLIMASVIVSNAYTHYILSDDYGETWTLHTYPTRADSAVYGSNDIVPVENAFFIQAYDATLLTYDGLYSYDGEIWFETDAALLTPDGRDVTPIVQMAANYKTAKQIGALEAAIAKGLSL